MRREKSSIHECRAYHDETEPGPIELHLMRRLRSEAQSLRNVLVAVKNGEYGLEDQLEYLRRTHGDIQDLTTQLEQENRTRPVRSDSLASIINHWQQANPLLDKLLKTQAASDAEHTRENGTRTLLRRLTHIDHCLAFIIEMTVERTSTERVCRWLSRNEPGDVLSFHRIFEDELPSNEGRRRILGLLASKPRAIEGGLIDPIRGLIYCYPTNPWMTASRIGLVILALSICVATMNYYDFISSESHAPGLTSAWLSLLAGMATQHFVARRKLEHPDIADHWMPLARWHKYVAARAGNLVALVFASAAILGLYATGLVGVARELSLYDTFLLGYGFDSVLDLVCTEMDKKTEKLRESRLA